MIKRDAERGNVPSGTDVSVCEIERCTCCCTKRDKPEDRLITLAEQKGR